MDNLENVIQEIDWDNDIDTDSYDMKDYFPGLFQFDDYSNLSRGATAV